MVRSTVQMLHNKSKGNRPFGSGEKYFFFTMYAWRPSSSFDHFYYINICSQLLNRVYTITNWPRVRSAFGDILTFFDKHWYRLTIVSSTVYGRFQSAYFVVRTKRRIFLCMQVVFRHMLMNCP